MPRFIDPVLQARIETELDAIEREEAVRILLAVESGSRAWGFPSRDSDYDVRFLYVRTIDAYLAVTPRRDVIERPVDVLLDINGWDLRKALQLMLRSNAVLIEWLTSPVRYRSWGGVEELLALARSAANPTALAYHYQSQVRSSLEPSRDTGGPIRLKSYCYAVRSALALAWLRQCSEAPPMEIGALLAGLTLPQELVRSIDQVIAEKREATEDATTPRLGILDTFIAEAFSPIVPKTPASARSEIAARADAFLAALLLDRTDTASVSKAGSTCS
jgi:predicted nucleotidyltransferase